MNKANYISVDEFKSWNPEIDFSAYSVETLSGMITRASAWVDDYLYYSLKVEDISNEVCEAIVSTDGDLMVFPRKIPIVSVSKLELKLGTYDTELSLEESDGTKKYDIPEPAHHILYSYTQIELTGKVSLRHLWQIRQRQYFTRLSYRAGYETIPDAIKDGVNLVTKDIFQRQRNPAGVSSMSQGGISMAFRVGPSDLIADAKILLNPYVRRHL